MAGKGIEVQVIRSFVDKETCETHLPGDVFEVTKERLAQINACGAEQNFVPLVRVLKEEKEKRK